MNEIEDLKQDVAALEMEITDLETTRDRLKKDIDKEHHENLEDNPIVRNFKDLFSDYPQLKDVLLRDTYPVERKVSSETNTDADGATEFTPRKKMKLNENMHDSESQTHAIMRHQMFDSEVSDVLDSTMNISPSKVRESLQLEPDGNKELDELMSKIIIENTFRLFGISFFPVVDPMDLKLSEETRSTEIVREMLGIRLEVYDVRNAEFRDPHYVLLKRNLKNKAWAIYRHTIPNYIDVYGIFDDLNEQLIVTYEDVYVFAKALYSELLILFEKCQIFESLERNKVISNLDIDMKSTIITFKLEFYTVRLYLKDDNISNVNITSDDPEVSDRVLIERMEVYLLGSVHKLETKLTTIIA